MSFLLVWQAEGLTKFCPPQRSAKPVGADWTRLRVSKVLPAESKLRLLKEETSSRGKLEHVFSCRGLHHKYQLQKHQLGMESVRLVFNDKSQLCEYFWDIVHEYGLPTRGKTRSVARPTACDSTWSYRLDPDSPKSLGRYLHTLHSYHEVSLFEIWPKQLFSVFLELYRFI